MTKEKGLIKIDDEKSINEFLKQPTLKIAEALSGLLASETKDWKLTAGKLVQATIKGTFLTQLGRELTKYAEEGKIKEDYFATAKNQASLKELLQFIDEEVPDEERFKAMKSIFLYQISKETSDDEATIANELMHICKKLNSGDVLVLKANYKIANGGVAEGVPSFDINNTSVGVWLNTIAHQIGHKISSLVEAHEDNLMSLKLISRRTMGDNSGIARTKYYRMTGLGYKLCEFITKYE